MESISRHHIFKVLLKMCCVFMLLGVAPLSAVAEQTAAQLVAASNAKIKQAGGITAVFNMSSGNQTTSGTLKTTGTKFVINTPGVATWYDGKSMWTYNAHTKETTLVNPTPSELAETNPLLLISSKLSQYTVSYAKKSQPGCQTVVLVPKTKGAPVKSMHVSINKKTGLPEKLVAVPSSGATITVTLSSIKTSQKHSDATFVYPKAKYPKVTVVDLR